MASEHLSSTLKVGCRRISHACTCTAYVRAQWHAVWGQAVMMLHAEIPIASTGTTLVHLSSTPAVLPSSGACIRAAEVRVDATTGRDWPVCWVQHVECKAGLTKRLHAKPAGMSQ